MDPRRWLTVSLVLGAGLSARHTLQAQSTLRKSLDGMHLASDSGRIAVIFAPGDEMRAKQVRSLVEPMIVFYQARFGIVPRVALAVLDSAHWSRLTGTLAPFPVPFVTDSPSVAVIALNPLPAPDANALRTMLVEPPMPAAAAATMVSFNRDPTRMIDVATLAADAVALHEVGHLYSTAYGIATPRRWMSEFLANYWQTAFSAGAYPDVDQYAQQMGKAMAGPPKAVTYTTLPDLDRLGGPPAMPVSNYEWYQGELTARARRVYDERGLRFLTEMRTAFPRGERGALTDEEIAKRLEAISPGWRQWLSDFGADRRKR